jgi:RHS repeat-associated protein
MERQGDLGWKLRNCFVITSLAIPNESCSRRGAKKLFEGSRFLGRSGGTSSMEEWETTHHCRAVPLGLRPSRRGLMLTRVEPGGGYPVWQGTFLPYGQEWNPQLTTNHSKPGSPAKRFPLLGWKFTGKERDAESGLDFFGARFYSSTMGRWMESGLGRQARARPLRRLSRPPIP